MDFQQLKYFQTVARYENMSLAANELFISQPSLSKSITKLETEVGMPLFDHVGRNIKLNACGMEFLRTVDHIFQEFKRTKRLMEQLHRQQDEQINLALNIPSLLPFLLKKFLPDHANIRISSENGSNSDLRHMLECTDVDFCISAPSIGGQGISSIPLIDEELRLFVPPAHRYAHVRRPLPLSAFADDPFLVFKKDFNIRNLTDTLCRKAGFVPKITYESEINDSLIYLVNIGLGVSLLPVHKWEHSKDAYCSISISDPLCKRVVALSFKKNRKVSKSAHLFEAHIIDFFRSLQPVRLS
ncbi:MAG: LysR family transcriptional regulator [Sporolactobacillus sp.]|jgi:DNA-binding transcriptional LysR family regulator|nr:LysR family transcriptional regulator [Sporolactobacillus sp.]